ncbi:hypothetical protein Vretimale_2435 [Volvox reticuliferus]|uniref:Uncharacterized protein n=1 Tax=Volvox reticuliferus TaxID=1737510 RepID=A0A8J4G423_9CHLO|nr:hypothetical protein Vretifemale_4720 [Volvox reticuliferus]GIL96674.1 hypothetical protein Vretimale_2435 [Volvox reticuliferus]
MSAGRDTTRQGCGAASRQPYRASSRGSCGCGSSIAGIVAVSPVGVTDPLSELMAPPASGPGLLGLASTRTGRCNGQSEARTQGWPRRAMLGKASAAALVALLLSGDASAREANPEVPLSKSCIASGESVCGRT